MKRNFPNSNYHFVHFTRSHGVAFCAGLFVASIVWTIATYTDISSGSYFWRSGKYEMPRIVFFGDSITQRGYGHDIEG